MTRSQEHITTCSKQSPSNAFQMANFSTPNRIESETKLSEIQREARRMDRAENQKNARFAAIWKRRCEKIARSSTELATAAQEHQNMLNSLLPLLADYENLENSDDCESTGLDMEAFLTSASATNGESGTGTGAGSDTEGSSDGSGPLQYGVIKTLVSRLFNLNRKYVPRRAGHGQRKPGTGSTGTSSLSSVSMPRPVQTKNEAGSSNGCETEITTIFPPPSSSSAPVCLAFPNNYSYNLPTMLPLSASSLMSPAPQTQNQNQSQSCLNISASQQLSLRDIVLNNSSAFKNKNNTNLENVSFSTNKSVSWRNFTYDTYEYWSEITDVTLSLSKNAPSTTTTTSSTGLALGLSPSPKLQVTRNNKHSPVTCYSGPFEGVILNGFCIKSRIVTAPFRPGRIHAYGLGVDLSGLDDNTFIYSFSVTSILLGGKKCGQSIFLLVKIDMEGEGEEGEEALGGGGAQEQQPEERRDNDSPDNENIEYQPACEESKNTAWFNIFYDPNNNSSLGLGSRSTKCFD